MAALLRMGRDFLAGSGLPLPWDAPWVSMQVAALMTDPAGLVLVLGAPAQGFLAARAGAHIFSPVPMAQELAWWIDPPARSARAATGLLDAYEAWARERGCVAAGLGLYAGADERLPEFYRRRGYAPVEGHYLKALV